jgi:hypothetical protein
MNYPKYGIGDAIAGFSTLMHWGAVMLAVVLGAAGIVCFFFSVIAAIILIALSGMFLIVQIISRMRHMSAIMAVRPQGSSFYVLDHKTGRRYLPNDVRGVSKKEFEYSDPWRPITVGYPGLKIELANVKEPVEHLYPWGLESLRDEMFLYLKEQLSADVTFED